MDFFTDEDQHYPQRIEARIYITPPDENALTDEDSEDEETETFDISRLGRNILRAEAEYRGHIPMPINEVKKSISNVKTFIIWLKNFHIRQIGVFTMGVQD